MIFELNTDTQTKEILEGRRRYREQLASSYAAGKIEATKELNGIIADKDAVIAEKDSIISEKNTVISKKDEVISEKDEIIQKYRNKYGDIE